MLPFIIPLTYFCILPPAGGYSAMVDSRVSWTGSGSEYTALPEDEIESEGVMPVGVASMIVPMPGLSSADKWRLVRPLLIKYMLPLCELLCKWCQLLLITVI
jgi:battenin